MPIGPIPEGCVAVGAPPVADFTNDLSQVGVCQFNPSGLKLSDVVVTNCAIDFVLFERVTILRAVGVTITLHIDFTFTGTIDGFTFKGSGSCGIELFFYHGLLPVNTMLLPPADCAGELTCSARYAGVDPQTGIHTFIVHITGDVTCVIRRRIGKGPEYTVVKDCPSNAQATLSKEE